MNNSDAAVLRKRAEEKAAESPKETEPLSPAATRLTLHELRVHQIELEMQNEELRRAQAELDASRALYFDLYDLAPVGYVTVAENGLPGYAFDVWYGLFAPSKTPRATLAQINGGTTKALADAETAKRFAGAGVDLIGGSVEDSNKYLQAEMSKWSKVIREAGIKAD